MMLEDERRQIVDHCQRLRADGLVVGTSGNISVRSGDLVAVTPSGLDYDAMTPESIGVHRLDGSPVETVLVPTTELPMHLAVYACTDATAVVHTHSTAATALSTVADELPPIHYLVALFGGPVRVASYATYGTDALAENTIAALEGRTACVLGNHGTLTYGADVAEAYSRALYLEWLCEVYLRATGAGTPRLLPLAEIDRVREKIAGYGVHHAGDVPAGNDL
jgi:L-fuculose-phosphate aldolase